MIEILNSIVCLSMTCLLIRICYDTKLSGFTKYFLRCDGSLIICLSEFINIFISLNMVDLICLRFSPFI